MTSELITDAVDQELHIGDEVAYVHRVGSSVDINRRIITEMGYRDTPSYRADKQEPYLKLDGKNARPVMPYNVVRLEKVSLNEYVALQQRALEYLEHRAGIETIFDDDIPIGIIWREGQGDWHAEYSNTGMSWGSIDTRRAAMQLLYDEASSD